MSTSEHFERIKHLEQHPELLPQVELHWESIGSETSEQSADDAQAETESSALDWPDPEPLSGGLPPVPAFDPQLLPAILRPLAEDTAERMQVPLDYPAVVAVLCLSGVTNRRASIQPKAADTSWVIVPNLWGGIIGAPGLMKSPVMNVLTHPLMRIEADWRNDAEAAEHLWTQQQEEAGLRRAAWREQFKASTKTGKDAPPRPIDEPVAPKPQRLLTQDATFESLHAMMAENPAGIFVVRDELTGWLAGLERQGREGERAFYLQAWNGDTAFTIDRIGRGNVHVEACCVSMLGGIQPSRLRAYMAETLRDGPSNDGLMQRFQVLVYPDPPREWRYVDRPPNSAANTDAEKTYRRLASMDSARPLRLRFAPDAQELFIDWLKELEAKLRSHELHPALVSHLAKYRKLMPALALLFELANGGTDTVSLEHARQAGAFCEYLEGHVRRIYSMVVSADRQAAAELGHRLKGGWKRDEGVFSVRDVYQNNWRDLSAPDAVRRTLAVLQDAGWVRLMESDQQRKGRPSETYLINPKVTRRSSEYIALAYVDPEGPNNRKRA